MITSGQEIENENACIERRKNSKEKKRPEKIMMPRCQTRKSKSQSAQAIKLENKPNVFANLYLKILRAGQQP